MAQSRIRGRLPLRVLQQIPEAWRPELATVAARRITRGMSGAVVFRLATRPESILKLATGKYAASVRDEITRTRWLAAQGIAVPEILRAHAGDDIGVMQMQKLPGVPADHCRWPASRLLPTLGRAFARLHALPQAACPFDESLAVRLSVAAQAVERDEVNVEDFDEKNLGVAPEVLLANLTSNAPPEDLVVAHGDADFSNIIVGPDGTVAFIDCGHAGRADRYLDLGLLGAEVVERFGREGLAIFMAAYGEKDWKDSKATYYCDLYEFF
jgi:aminoglycoside 3'-phosphotransferase-2